MWTLNAHMMQRLPSFRGYSDERRPQLDRANPQHSGSSGVSGHMHRPARQELVELLFSPIKGFKFSEKSTTIPPAVCQQSEGARQRSFCSHPQAFTNTTPCGRSASATDPGKESTPQLTIFYNGTVNVYDVSADKVCFVAVVGWFRTFNCLRSNADTGDATPEHNGWSGVPWCNNNNDMWQLDGQAHAIITMLASRYGNCGQQDPPDVDQSARCNVVAGSALGNVSAEASASPVGSCSKATVRQYEEFRTLSFPIARKQSLQRFLQKRKDRLNGVDPYAMGGGLSKGCVKQLTYINAV